MFKVSIEQIDVCHVDYLTDHHNREGELLEGIAIHSSLTWGGVKYELANCYYDDKFYDKVKNDIVVVDRLYNKELDDAFQGIDLNAKVATTYNLEINDDGNDDPLQLWYLITITKENEDE